MADPLLELMELLESISGIQLKNEKRSMVETRLGRRVRALGLASVNEYVNYFHAHRADEMVHALSLIATHTTEFFREEAHFDYLSDNVFPKIFATQNSINIWSAASSTGQEVYSLAITLLEYIRVNSIPIEKVSIKIYGSDIDQISLQTAREGIYPYEQVSKLNPELVERYFEIGSEELQGLVRVKDHVHQLCEFKNINLLTDSFPGVDMDIVFLRNTVIYFKAEDIESIFNRIRKVMTPDARIFLGHSESLMGLNTSFKKIGNSIYELSSQKWGQDLIVIGASTGGVEALGVVLKQFAIGCPPILIVQHIPGVFSKAFADRLNEICDIHVSEAQHNEILEPSHAYIAPGGFQMKLLQASAGLMIEINSDPSLTPHKPSVDYLFKSIVPLAKGRSISAALLTGMGSDGAEGLKELKNAGVYTVVQNEETSVVFGMPGAAVELGGAIDVVPLASVASRLIGGFSKRRAA